MRAASEAYVGGWGAGYGINGDADDARAPCADEAADKAEGARVPLLCANLPPSADDGGRPVPADEKAVPAPAVEVAAMTAGEAAAAAAAAAAREACGWSVNALLWACAR